VSKQPELKFCVVRIEVDVVERQTAV
jgi:hypothetical protein